MIRVVREAKRTPVDIAERLARAGGLNRLGEPNFRVVWGWSRLEWIGGKWTDCDESGNLVREVVQLRQEPKYTPHDRWHLERWMPPESYGSPESWLRETAERCGAERIAALGPYPSRGDWEHCWTLATPEGGFLALDANVCEYAVRIVLWGAAQSRAARREAIFRAEERRQRDYERYVDGVLWNEPRFHGQPHTTVASG